MIENERFSQMDPVGRVFYMDGNVYRGIYDEAKNDVMTMFEIGMIDELISKKLIPQTEIVDLEVEGYCMVLKHERIQSITYIQEWSFSMIQDAAIMILDLEKILLRYGFTLKDCHSYNVLFNKNRPMYVDLGSFVKFVNPGWAVREFYSTYHQILEMMSLNSSIARERIMLRCDFGVRYNNYYINGIKTGDDYFDSINEKIIKVSQNGNVEDFIKLIEKERREICDYKLFDKSEWGNYQDDYCENVSQVEGENGRFRYVVDICKDLNISSVLELGANQGVLSRTLAKIVNIKRIYATDYDEIAVDKMYTYLKNEPEDSVLQKVVPAVYNFKTNIVPDISLKTFPERFKSDVVIALALTHHLILAQHISIDSIFERMYSLTNKYLIVEYMPKGLWDGIHETPPIPRWYSEEWFVENMSKLFKISVRQKIGPNRILFFAEKIAM
ncbi:MAG: hypothetical protein PUF03_05430 [Lachnospiraceae bacterium]|nr:hypothetical protein [Lachnospiraceae bacterium]